MKPHQCRRVSTIGVLSREDPDMLKVYFISAVKSSHSSSSGPSDAVLPPERLPPVRTIPPEHEGRDPSVTAPAVASRLSRMNSLLSIGGQIYSIWTNFRIFD